jgi:hypothetical protein
MAESKSQKSKRGGSQRSGGSSSKSSSSKSSSSKNSSSRSSSGKGSSRKSANGRATRDVVLDAAQQLQELIGRPVEGVLGMEKDGDEWTLTVQVLELERIPNTTDVLGRYEVTVDGNGEITAMRRTRRYFRAEAGDD